MNRIDSVSNPRVKEAVKLRDRRARRKAGCFLVEGKRELEHAVEAGWAIDTLFVEPERAASAGVVERAAAAGSRVLHVSGAVYEKLVVREGAGGLLGVLPIPDASPEKLRLGPSSLVLAAVGIEKPGNVGALLRSADALGVDALVVEGGTDLWNPNVVRASLGCLFTVPVAVVAPGGLLPWLRSLSARVVAAVPDAGALPSQVDLTGHRVILVGSEENGLPPGLLAAADDHVRIPMRGRADSLNVSVSAGILLYEADRQRNPAP